jgi:ABC-type multidrug transport system ATPase subunit
MENLSFFADVFGVRGRERKERIDQLLHFARLTEFRKRLQKRRCTEHATRGT